MNALAGRLCMLAGMIILPIGFSIGMFRDDSKTEVRLLFIGAALFFVGWLMAKSQR